MNIDPTQSSVAALRDIHNVVVCTRNAVKSGSVNLSLGDDERAGYIRAMNEIAVAVRLYARSHYGAVIEE